MSSYTTVGMAAALEDEKRKKRKSKLIVSSCISAPAPLTVFNAAISDHRSNYCSNRAGRCRYSCRYRRLEEQQQFQLELVQVHEEWDVDCNHKRP